MVVSSVVIFAYQRWCSNSHFTLSGSGRTNRSAKNMATPLAQAKTALRRTIKAKLKALDAADIAAQSQIVIEKLRALEAFQRARR